MVTIICGYITYKDMNCDIKTYKGLVWQRVKGRIFACN